MNARGKMWQSPRGLREADSGRPLLCLAPLPRSLIPVWRNANSHYPPCAGNICSHPCLLTSLSRHSWWLRIKWEKWNSDDDDGETQQIISFIIPLAVERSIFEIVGTSRALVFDVIMAGCGLVVKTQVENCFAHFDKLLNHVSSPHIRILRYPHLPPHPHLRGCAASWTRGSCFPSKPNGWVSILAEPGVKLLVQSSLSYYPSA